MKKLILLVSLVLPFLQGYAQSNQTEAKAAYMLAEESYSQKDYKTSLDYLNQVKTTLGSSNCKILYLEIIVTRELYPDLVVGGEKLLTLINEFEKSPDYANFTEDKALEIAKLKLSLKADMKALKDKTDKENAAAFAKEKAFNTIYNARGPWNVTKVELDAALPLLKVREWKRVEKYDTFSAPGYNYDSKPAKGKFNWSIENGLDYSGKIANIGFYKDSVYRYQSFLVYSTGKSTETRDLYLKAHAIIKEYTEKLGFEPINVATGTLLSYDWKREKNRIVLELLYTTDSKVNIESVQLIESLYAN